MAEPAIEKDPVQHVEDIDVTKEAKRAAQSEHETTLFEALKSNKKAAAWSAIISLTIIMEGYDVGMRLHAGLRSLRKSVANTAPPGLIYQFFAYPSFAETFGNWDPTTKSYQVSGPWQAGLSNGANCGIIIGGFLNGYLSARYGYKKVILASLFFMNWLIFIPFFAQSAQVLLAGQILCGLTWGVFATTGPAYASEVCPLVLRGYLTCYVNLCWAIGQLIAAGILYGLLDLRGQWSYRVCYAIQWVWPIPIFIIILFGPESPWYLIRNDRVEDAYKALAKLDNKGEEAHRQTVAQIMHTLKIEDQMDSGFSYFDLFRGVDLRRTGIVCMTFAGQVLSGSTFAYGPTYFFQQAGISTSKSYEIAVGGTAVAFVGTVRIPMSVKRAY